MTRPAGWPNLDRTEARVRARARVGVRARASDRARVRVGVEVPGHPLGILYTIGLLQASSRRPQRSELILAKTQEAGRLGCLVQRQTG